MKFSAFSLFSKKIKKPEFLFLNKTTDKDFNENLRLNNTNTYQVKLINLYIIIISIVFLVHSLRSFFKLEDLYTGFFLLFIFLFFFSTLFIKRKNRNKSFICMVFIFVCFVIFFYEAYLNRESGIYLYYFPWALSIAFFYNYPSDRKYIIILYTIIIICILTNMVTDYSLFTNSNASQDVYKSIFKVSFFNSFFLVIINLIFIFKKKYHLSILQKQDVEKNVILEKLRYSARSKTDTLKIQELILLATANDPSFFSSFSEQYPFFFPKLLERAPDLSPSQLELCALIRLNFSTKDIAKNMRLSVRAVEGRKYRLRKKLNFNSDKELVNWMLNLNFML